MVLFHLWEEYEEYQARIFLIFLLALLNSLLVDPKHGHGLGSCGLGFSVGSRLAGCLAAWLQKLASACLCLPLPGPVPGLGPQEGPSAPTLKPSFSHGLAVCLVEIKP